MFKSTKSAGSGERDVAKIVAAMFEKEVNDHLSDYFQQCLPESFLLSFSNRQIAGEIEIDSFSCMLLDGGTKGISQPELGIEVLVPENCEYLKAAEAPSEILAGSPHVTTIPKQGHGNDTEGDPLEPEKSVIGETYCGNDERKARGKIGQLENAICTMLKRRQKDFPNSNCPEDVTSVIGAAVFSFLTLDDPQEQSIKKFRRWLLQPPQEQDADPSDGHSQDWINEEKTPNLWRLAKARRLFLVVPTIEKSEISAALCVVAEQMVFSEERIKVMLKEIKTIGVLVLLLLIVQVRAFVLAWPWLRGLAMAPSSYMLGVLDSVEMLIDQEKNSMSHSPITSDAVVGAASMLVAALVVLLLGRRFLFQLPWVPLAWLFFPVSNVI